MRYVVKFPTGISQIGLDNPSDELIREWLQEHKVIRLTLGRDEPFHLVAMLPEWVQRCPSEGRVLVVWPDNLETFAAFYDGAIPQPMGVGKADEPTLLTA